MNKDQAKGRNKEARGKVKEIAGKIVGNKDLERDGVEQNASGKRQPDAGDRKHNLKKADRKH